MEPQSPIQQTAPATDPSNFTSTPRTPKKRWLMLATIAVVCFGTAGWFVATREQTVKMPPLQTKPLTANGVAEDVQVSPMPSLPPYSEAQLEAVASKKATALPLGDNQYTTSAPQKGYIYLCHLQKGQGGAYRDGRWISGKNWNPTQKPPVSGTITWPNATFANTVNGTDRVITGNGLPVTGTTGSFPVAYTDPAYQYDRNPNTIKGQSITLTLPLVPTLTAQPSCMGGEVGIMLNGVPLFNGFDAEMRDAAAHEIQDSCSGHPQESGEYHYHSLSNCFSDIHETTVLGFALDGIPITGPVLANGQYLTTNNLDACHGITSEITLDGKKQTVYHYVLTQDFPYSVSCFRAKPVTMQVAGSGKQQPQGDGSQVQAVQPSQTLNQPTGNKQPPQAAIAACANSQTGQQCSFTTPNSSVSGTCQLPPNQTSLACVPQNRPTQ